MGGSHIHTQGAAPSIHIYDKLIELAIGYSARKVLAAATLDSASRRCRVWESNLVATSGDYITQDSSSSFRSPVVAFFLLSYFFLRSRRALYNLLPYGSWNKRRIRRLLICLIYSLRFVRKACTMVDIGVYVFSLDLTLSRDLRMWLPNWWQVGIARYGQ